jgi:hypothetical protein
LPRRPLSGREILAFALATSAIPAAAQPYSRPSGISAGNAPVVAPVTEATSIGNFSIEDRPPDVGPRTDKSFTVDAGAQDTPDPEVMFLSRMPVEDVTQGRFSSYITETTARASAIGNPVLSRMIKMTLAQLEADPAHAIEIRRKHLQRMAAYFYRRAETAAQPTDPATGKKRTPDIPEVLTAVQIAVHCDPAHLRARTLFAAMLDGLGKPDAAFDTLVRGEHYAKASAPEATPYYALYFKLLEKQGRDEAALRRATELLRPPSHGEPPLPGALRGFLAQKAAAAAANLGRYEESIALFRDNPPRTLNACLTEAAAYFNSGRTGEAIQRLLDAARHMRGEDRNLLLQQLAIRRAELGQWAPALAIAAQRVREFPASLEARVQHFWLLLKNNRLPEAGREAQDLLTRHPDNHGMLLSIANIAKSRGDFALVERCRRARMGGAIASAEAAANPVAASAPTLFDYLHAEALVRARRPREAIAAIRERRLDQPEQTRRNPNALPLLAAACFMLNDTESARRNIEDYLTEPADEATQARIHELQNLLTSPPESTPVVLTPAKIREISTQIQRLSSRPRVIHRDNFVPVGRLLTHCGDHLDALRVLERGAAQNPGDGQLRAEYIAARITSGAIAASTTADGMTRKDLCAEIEELLTLRRPDPRAWTPIARWLASASASASPKAALLRPRVEKLVRRDLAAVD